MPSLLQKLNDLRSDLAQAVQLVVDEWELNEDGFSDDLGSGGVCDLVSEAMSGVIYDKIDSVEILDGGHDGDDHAWIIVVSSTEAVGVNIPPGVYETGGGYSWKKIENVTVEPSDISLWEINRKDVEERTDRIAANWSYEDKFVFQGRVYDMKIRGSDSQGAVVYQKSPKCLFGKDGDEWFFQAGSRTLFDAAMRHLKRDKVAADSDDLRLQNGPGFHLQPDGTWKVEQIPPDAVREARFSGFLAIEGYWCAVFDTDGQTWAQKAAGDIPEIETKLSSIARRIAYLSQ